MRSRPSEPLLFLLPALLVTAAVILYPALQTVWLGLHSFVLFDPDSMRFIGLGNFAAIVADELFWVSLSNSVVWVVCAVGLQFALGLVTALLLNQTFTGRSLARALVVVPWALPCHCMVGPVAGTIATRLVASVRAQAWGVVVGIW